MRPLFGISVTLLALVQAYQNVDHQPWMSILGLVGALILVLLLGLRDKDKINQTEADQ